MGCAGGSSFLDRYSLGKKLGEGGFAAVLECTHKQSKRECAVKVVSCGGGDTDAKLREANNEVAMWRRIGVNEHICEFIEHYHEGRIFYIVQEVCRGGELADGLASTSSTFDLRRIFKGMLLGLQACHQANVIHRDIKPGNFLLGGSDKQTVKLCDFGVACSASSQELFGKFGTVPYMSPEMIVAEKTRKSYGLATDVWSIGVAVYLMLYGDFPAKGKGGDTESWEAAITAKNYAPTFKRKDGVTGPVLSEVMESFVRMLLERDPYKRTTAKRALEHEMLSGSTEIYSGISDHAVFAEAVRESSQFAIKAGMDETLDNIRRRSMKRNSREENKRKSSEKSSKSLQEEPVKTSIMM